MYVQKKWTWCVWKRVTTFVWEVAFFQQFFFQDSCILFFCEYFCLWWLWLFSQCPPGGSFCVFFGVCVYFSLWWLDFFVLNHAIYAFFVYAWACGGCVCKSSLWWLWKRRLWWLWTLSLRWLWRLSLWWLWTISLWWLWTISLWWLSNEDSNIFSPPRQRDQSGDFASTWIVHERC